MSTSANVSTFVPPQKPGPYIYDKSKFFNGGTLMLDTSNLAVNANSVNVCRVRAYGDPVSNIPAITALGIATPLLYTHYQDAGNVDQFRVAVAVSNTQVQVVANTIVTGSFTVGQPFGWTPPPFSVLSRPTIRLNGQTLGQTYPLSGGQLRGFCPLYVPQPPLATSGQLYDLNGGFVSGTSIIYSR